MAVKYLAGDRLIGTAAERAALSGNTLGSIAQTSWKELDRVTLGSAGADLDTGTFTAKDNLMILAHLIPSTNMACDLTFNADSGSNYAKRRSNNGGSDSTSTSDSLVDLRYNSNEDTFIVINIRNIASKEKLCLAHLTTTTSGANSPNRAEVAFKWANTSDQITRVKFNKGSFTNYASGSELIILGCDDDEADSGTNFWQELSNTNLSAGVSDNINSGTITAKKWLMVDSHIVTATYNHGNTNIIVNGDTAQANYSMRRNYDGANESTYAGSNPTGSSNGMYTGFGENRTNLLMNTMIANVSGKEKLMFWHMSHANDGATNEPHRTEAVEKWHTTSGQITDFKILAGTGSHIDANSRMRVWGSD